MTSSQEKRIAQIVQKRFQKLYDNQQEIFNEVEVYHQMYRAYMTESEAYPWDYQYVDPVVFALLRNMMARMNPDGVKVILESRTGSTDEAREVNQAVVNWEMSEMAKTLRFYNFIFRGLLAGRAYMSTGWRYEPAVKVKYGEGESEGEKVLREIVNRAEAKNVRFQDIFIPNLNTPELDEQPYLIERLMMRYGDMLQDNELAKEAGREPVWVPEYLEKIKKQKMFTSKVDYGEDLPTEDGSKEDMFLRSQYVAMLKMQTKEGDVIYVPEKEQEWILNKDQGNPHWHGHYNYLTWAPFPEDDSFFSLGIVQPIADLQAALSSTLNQFLTNARKASNPMWIAGSGAAQTPDWMFINRPDGVVRIAGDVDQVKQATTVDTSKTMLNMRRELNTAFERATSMASLYVAGVSGGNTPQVNKTATGAKVIDANIDVNMQMLINLFGSQALKTLGEHFLELNAQYITEEQTVKITGKQGVEFIRVRPEEVTANFDVVVNPDLITKSTPQVRQASLLNMKAMADQEKDVKIDKRPLWKAIIAAFPEMDNVEDIIIDPEEQAAEAIDYILKTGQVPEVRYNQDHKAMIAIVQKYLLDNGPQIPPEITRVFLAYVEELRKSIQAANPNLLAPPQPGMLPTDEVALGQSMEGQLSPGNPTQQLPVQLTQGQLGGI